MDASLSFCDGNCGKTVSHKLVKKLSHEQWNAVWCFPAFAVYQHGMLP